MRNETKLTTASYLTIGSMLFGLFFGAGNLIFPVHMGQLAGSNVHSAIIGFLITGIGLPFLGIVAMGITNSDSLFDLASRVHPLYAYFMTVALYLTIGPFFATPRLATTSFEVGFAPSIAEGYQTVALAIFTLLFFGTALVLSLKPAKILDYVGKILNPLFLIFLGILIVTAFFKSLGNISDVPVLETYTTTPFVNGFLEGYNTMDALASLAFGVIVIQAIKGLGVTKPSQIAMDTVKSGLLSVLLMGVIYTCLAYLGTMSVGQFPVSENGGIALAQISNYYFGTFGSILLAIIVTVACLKTAIGLITSGSETFYELFPQLLSYRGYVVLLSVVSGVIANVGLTSIIAYSLPVLMFLYPLAITLILLAIFSPLFKHRQIVYVCATLFTLPISMVDFLKAAPAFISDLNWVQNMLTFLNENLPLFEVGLGWLIPSLIGFLVGWGLSLFTRPLRKRNK